MIDDLKDKEKPIEKVEKVSDIEFLLVLIFQSKLKYKSRFSVC